MLGKNRILSLFPNLFNKFNKTYSYKILYVYNKLGHRISQRGNFFNQTFRILVEVVVLINSFLASGNFCHLLISFANSFDLKRQSGSGSKPLDTLIVFLKEI